jgi:hypothetical protein
MASAVLQGVDMAWQCRQAVNLSHHTDTKAPAAVRLSEHSKMGRRHYAVLHVVLPLGAERLHCASSVMPSWL